MTAFTYPFVALGGAALALLALLAGLWAQARPGLGVRVVRQRPALQGLGMALILAGVGLGIAEPRWGLPEVPRLTVHVVVDASRSMLVPDCNGRSRWRESELILERLWSKPNPGIRYSLDLLTGDTIPLMPPGEDLALLQDALKAVQPGEIGSQGTSLGRGLPQIAATVEPKSPAVLLLLSDGEETWESPADARERALQFLKDAKLPLFAVATGSTLAQPVPMPRPAPGEAASQEPALSAANPDFLRTLAEGSGGKLLAPSDDLTALFQKLAQGELPLPHARSLQPSHPEWGAWVALAGLVLWLLSAGRPMRTWRPALGILLALGLSGSLQAQVPLPQSVKAFLAQTALDNGNLEAAQRWRPSGDQPSHVLLAAQIDLKARNFEGVLKTLTPLTGQGVPRPVPAWRAPALLLAARSQVALDHPDEAIAILVRLLKEQPGQADAVHNLQTLLKDRQPPPPNPKKPPPPPPPRPSQGARQDELEGIQQRLPQKPPPKGVKDL